MAAPMRPPILFPLFSPLDSLKGVGPKVAPLAEKVAGGALVRDLAFLAPTGLNERTRSSIVNATDGGLQTFVVQIEAHLPGGGGGRPYRIRGFDDTGWLFLAWFKGGGPHLAKAHPVGEVRAVSGEAKRFGVELQIAHPDYMLPLERADDIPRFEAVYPATAGLGYRQIGRLARTAVEQAPELPEWQDAAWLAREQWPGWREALGALHAPTSDPDLLPTAPARMRLAYDELLAHQLAMARRKSARRAEPARRIAHSRLADDIEAALPFSLTGAQSRTLAEARADLALGQTMTRLVQGDVGSGKTAVALMVLADAAASGSQAALMAPTEILARQHAENLAPKLAAVGITSVLLTGRDKGAARIGKLNGLASGETRVAFGTHALFQDEVRFADLGLAVVDEQHRFGVSERRRLQAKGEAVHLLALSATPIPRTLELALYGDIDVSRIDEKPPGRTPVVTTLSPSDRLPELVDRLKAAAARGAQAFWICPLVAESELLDVAAAEGRAEDLKAALGGGVGLVHGRMAPVDKDAAMAAFAEGRTSVLVATTVVEVGVDVPNASIMVIEHADRFGLAQLHQLRGRVGRGAERSACVLLYDPPLSESGKARLGVLRETDDGFLIAERDLQLRGSGDVMGLKQSGLPDYRFVDPAAHAALLPVAADDARLLLARDPAFASERGKAAAILEALFDWRPGERGWVEAG
ncbi:ATP-dependent DNA helicase RecG [soil metagenome]